jgi:predicted ATP-grasp superfamily ATP-dependent carboligase
MSPRLFVFEYLSGGGLDAAAGRLSPADLDLLHQGLAMRDALLADLERLPGLAVSCAVGPGVPAPRGAATLRPRPGEPVEDFVEREAASHAAAWVVAPETGGLLAALARRVAPARWLGCSAEAIALCGGKRATLERLAAHGVATPLDAMEAARRWVVKPDDGAGSVDTRVHPRREAAEADLAARRARGASATLEPWVEGEALSLSLACGGAAAVELLSVNRQQVEVAADGRLHYHGVAIDTRDAVAARRDALAATARAVAAAIPGLRGFVGIDLVWHAQRGPVVIEVNPRLTCAYVGLSAALGRNLAGELLARHAAGPAGRAAGAAVGDAADGPAGRGAPADRAGGPAAGAGASDAEGRAWTR